MKMVLVFSAFLLACASSGDPRDRVVTDFTPDNPKNYLIVHEGKVAQFANGKCYTLRAEDEDARINIALYLEKLLAERLPMLPRCRDEEWPGLELSYNAGYGVCIDCGGTKNDPRSAVGGIALVIGREKCIASAEWQYWRGGTAELVAGQFVFDLSNLFVNGLEKPIPPVRPNSSQ